MIVILGMIVGEFVRALVLASAGGVEGVPTLARLAKAAVVVIAIFMALQQLGVAEELVTAAFTLILGAIALAVGLAFGLGNRELAAEITRRWYEEGRARAEACQAASHRRPRIQDDDDRKADEGQDQFALAAPLSAIGPESVPASAALLPRTAPPPGLYRPRRRRSALRRRAGKPAGRSPVRSSTWTRRTESSAGLLFSSQIAVARLHEGRDEGRVDQRPGQIGLLGPDLGRKALEVALSVRLGHLADRVGQLGATGDLPEGSPITIWFRSSRAIQMVPSGHTPQRSLPLNTSARTAWLFSRSISLRSSGDKPRHGVEPGERLRRPDRPPPSRGCRRRPRPGSGGTSK